MKLRTLQGQFLQRRVERVDPTKYVDGVLSPTGERVLHVPVDTFAEAHGIRFLCPKCYAENGGPAGVHQVVCWFEGKVPDDALPKPGRWNPTGTGLDDLSFVPGRKTESVLLLGGCNWHGFVRNGEAA